MGQYVFAPAGASEKLRSVLLRTGVEYIGMKEGGPGSPWARGRRYIKGKLDCTGTAIKRACNTRNKVFNYDYERNGVAVYYYHIEMCAPIVDCVLRYLCDHINDPELPQVFSQQDYDTLKKITYSHRISQLHLACQDPHKDFEKQREDANKVYKALVGLHK